MFWFQVFTLIFILSFSSTWRLFDSKHTQKSFSSNIIAKSHVSIQLPVQFCEHIHSDSFETFHSIRPSPRYKAMKIQNSFPLIPILTSPVLAGPGSYGLCQAGCSSVVMACYSAAGFTWGATLGASAPASIIGCNAAYGSCQAACAATLLVPAP